MEKEFGWNGICIEAEPNAFSKLQKKRDCVSEHALVWSENGIEMEFVRWGIQGGVKEKLVEIAMLHKDDRYESYMASMDIRKTVFLVSETLESILDRCNAPKRMDFLSMDIEGSEYEALKNFPFNKYIFGAAVLERNHHEEKTKNLRHLMASNDYVLEHEGKVDDYYLHESQKNNKVESNNK